MRALVYIFMLLGAWLFTKFQILVALSVRYLERGSIAETVAGFPINVANAVILGLVVVRVMTWIKQRRLAVPARFGWILASVSLAVTVPTLLLFAFYAMAFLKGVGVSGIPFVFSGIGIVLSACVVLYCELPELYGYLPGRE